MRHMWLSQRDVVVLARRALAAAPDAHTRTHKQDNDDERNDCNGDDKRDRDAVEWRVFRESAVATDVNGSDNLDVALWRVGRAAEDAV